jgi:hypothetical protein
MSRMRLGFAAALTLLVAALMIWQILRDRQVAACLAAGQIWDGPTSSCQPARPAPILQRDNLKRT